MSFTDPIADMITRIRNAQLRALNTVSIPNSKLRARILDVLKGEGYISDYKPSSNEKDIRDLKKNPKIIVCTPGRLNDFIKRKKINLSLVKYFVLDDVAIVDR